MPCNVREHARLYPSQPPFFGWYLCLGYFIYIIYNVSPRWVSWRKSRPCCRSQQAGGRERVRDACTQYHGIVGCASGQIWSTVRVAPTVLCTYSRRPSPSRLGSGSRLCRHGPLLVPGEIGGVETAVMDSVFPAIRRLEWLRNLHKHPVWQAGLAGRQARMHRMHWKIRWRPNEGCPVALPGEGSAYHAWLGVGPGY